ncbi:MAG: heavy-metal-associated domain-containing protein [Actinomycetota bacterium]|nr:heavy-metal-associated domain-containing protein [Actinomycetota bacterium]
MTTTSYTVTGMTCGHCVNAVSTEITKLPGVSDVAVDLATGAVSVTSAAPLDDSDVQTAVEEAGFELAGTGGPPG